MVTRSKLYAQLDSLESELIDKLVPHLEVAASGNNDLVFCVNGFNPYNELKNKTDKTTEHLVNISSHILALKSKLGEPSGRSIAELICWYCREWSKSGDSGTNNAQDLAKQFLEEIKQQQSV